MPETDESNYSGRQTALLRQDEQELRDAQSSRVLTNNIHLTFKGKCMCSRLEGQWRVEMALMMKMFEMGYYMLI